MFSLVYLALSMPQTISTYELCSFVHNIQSVCSHIHKSFDQELYTHHDSGMAVSNKGRLESIPKILVIALYLFIYSDIGLNTNTFQLFRYIWLSRFNTA